MGAPKDGVVAVAITFDGVSSSVGAPKGWQELLAPQSEAGGGGGMRGTESYSERSQYWEDREALLDGGELAEYYATRGGDEKPPIHPVRMRALFVAAVLTVFTSSLVIWPPLSALFLVLQLKQAEVHADEPGLAVE